jgi:Family of unknown function (DUF5318)
VGGGYNAAVAMRARKRAEPDLGVVDYTLAKRALLRQVRRGILPVFDVCDAHPELMRAAKHVGQEIPRQCPVCERQQLRLLAYVYADDLKRDNGRVWELNQAISLAARRRGGASRCAPAVPGTTSPRPLCAGARASAPPARRSGRPRPLPLH